MENTQRPLSVSPATGAPGAAAPTSPVVLAETEQAAPSALPPDETRQRAVVLGIVNVSHLINHVNSAAGAVLYPVIMTQLGFGFLQIGILQTFYQLSAQGCQVIYGFLVPYFRRATLLGAGNVILGVATIGSALSQSFFQLSVTRVIGGMGSSAQNPVGAAMLVGYFQNARGRVLTLHHTAGNAGSLLAPAIVAGLLLFLDWRAVFLVLAIPSILMGVSYFFLRDMVAPSSASKKARARASLHDYRECLRNRNVILVSLIQMVGAAGRGTGINDAFLIGFFIVVLGADVPTAAALLMVYEAGGLFGPLAIGWLSDRLGRKPVIVLTLVGSTATTLWLLVHHGVTPWLVLNLVAYGSVVSARGSLTQAMVSDAVPLSHTDTAFSIYFFIGFISGPLWTFLMGWIIDAHSFANAFAVVSVSYLLGVCLVLFTRFARQAPPATPASA